MPSQKAYKLKLESKKWLNILSAFFGLIGTILMVYGVLTSSPKDLANLSGLYLPINPDLLKSFVVSSIDILLGLVFIAISFLLQLFLNLLEDKLYLHYIYQTKGKIITLSVLASITIAVILPIRHVLIERRLFATHKEMAYSSLTKQFNYHRSHNRTYKEKVVLEDGQIGVIRKYMNKLSFKRNNGESEIEYFKRYCEYLGVEFGDEIDFEKSGVR